MVFHYYKSNNKPGMVTHVYNSGTQEAETGLPWVLGQHDLQCLTSIFKTTKQTNKAWDVA